MEITVVGKNNNQSKQPIVDLISKSKEIIPFASQSIAVKQSQVVKPPPKVVDEEEYVSNLEAIISRDFFPDLTKLKNTTEWMQAEAENDLVKMREIQNRLLTERRKTTPACVVPSMLASSKIGAHASEGQQKVTSDAPSDTKSSQKKKQSLDEYHYTHASEDNQSFHDLLVHQQTTHRERFARFFGKDSQVQSDGKAHLIANAPANKDLSIPKNSNADDDHTQGLLTWQHKTKNELMYEPEGYTWSAEELTEVAKQFSSKTIDHAKTRFQGPIWNSKKGLSKSQLQRNNEANNFTTLNEDDFRLLPHDNNQPIDLDDLMGVRRADSELDSKDNNEMFPLLATPRLDHETTNFTTWGEIGTPLALDLITPSPSSRATGNATPFRIPAMPRKERVLFSTLDKINTKKSEERESRSKRTRLGTLGTPQTPRTPASPFLGGSAEPLDKQLRASYSKKISTPGLASGANSRATTPNSARIATPQQTPRDHHHAHSARVGTPSTPLLYIKVKSSKTEKL